MNIWNGDKVPGEEGGRCDRDWQVTADGGCGGNITLFHLQVEKIEKVVLGLCQFSGGRYEVKRKGNFPRYLTNWPSRRIKKSSFNKNLEKTAWQEDIKLFLFHPHRAWRPCVGRDWRKTMTKILERAEEKKLSTVRMFERAVGSLTFQLAYPLK